ncbi:MAG: transglutaminase domain-containing protein [Bdellovibrionota bacterium]
MKSIVTLLVVLLQATLAQAAGTYLPPAEHTVQNCATVEWEKVECTYFDGTGTYATAGPVADAVAITGYGMESVGDAAWSLASRFKKDAPSCYGPASKLSKLKSYAKKVVGGKSLSSCQKACVAKCITSHYLKTDYSKAGNSTACQAANAKAGDCQAFSALSDAVLDTLGAKSRTAHSFTMGHAYNKVEADGEWLYYEPMNDRCEFYVTP